MERVREKRDNAAAEAFVGGAVTCGDVFSLVGGRARMVKVVEDVTGGLADSAPGKQVFEHVVSI